MIGPFDTASCLVSAPVFVSGRGLHSGQDVGCVIRPGRPGEGLWIRRLDQPWRAPMKAHWSNVIAVERATVLGNRDGVFVSTIEHLLAALAGLNIDDAVIEVDGPELPIMDGSSRPFVDAILDVGLELVHAPRRFYKVVRTVRVVRDDGAWAEFRPATARRLSVEIFFPACDIGRQVWSGPIEASTFVNELCAARTFGFVEEISRQQERGLCLGASLDNAIGLQAGSVINPEGLRFPDEFVRHKALDSLGDLSLAGLPVIGEFRSLKPGHGLHRLLLEKLACDPGALIEVEGARPVRETIQAGWSAQRGFS